MADYYHFDNENKIITRKGQGHYMICDTLAKVKDTKNTHIFYEGIVEEQTQEIHNISDDKMVYLCKTYDDKKIDRIRERCYTLKSYNQR